MSENKDKKVKFLVPTAYDTLKNVGISLKNTERSTKMILKYFPGEFTEDLLAENTERYSIEKIFEIVKTCFFEEYGYKTQKFDLNNLYQRSINSYISNDKDEEIRKVVHIDELLESTLFSFFLAMFKWSKDFNNPEMYGDCFIHILYLMNDCCIFGEMQAADANDSLLKILSGDIQILNLAEDCYRTVLVFTIAHEIGHKYLHSISKTAPKDKEQHKVLVDEEYKADEIAYNVVLNMIMKKYSVDADLETYTYLAPMMYMDFFDLFYYTDRVLYKTVLERTDHPIIKKRKGHLFAIADRDKYDFDTEEGNDLYSCFLDVYDEYRTQLLIKNEKGKLDKIKRINKRNIMKGLIK